MNLFAVFLIAAASATTASSDPVPEPLDYATLGHTLSISSLRAGAHDESGTNDYFFKATMFGLVNNSEERNAPLDKRKKIEVDLGTFGDTQIVALGLWKVDDKAKQYKELKVSGNLIRELTARVMQENKIIESEVAVMVDVSMYEKGKKFWFFGEDLLVGHVTYYPIPQTKFEGALHTDSELLLTDDKGTQVKFAVTYPPAK